jgi:bacterioferritin
MASSPARRELIARLNEDLAREYQAIIAYVIYSQTLKGAEFMTIAKELQQHAAEELAHALTIAKHIDYLGGTPTAVPVPVQLCDEPRAMLRADLDNENQTIRAYRQRVQQAEVIGEYAIAEDLREILRQEQEHQIELATALGEEVPDVSQLPSTRAKAHASPAAKVAKPDASSSRKSEQRH